MKIAYIVPSLDDKGPVIVVKELCTCLMSMGHQCKVFYFDDIVELDMPCDTQRISFWANFNFDQWDIVHSHMLRPDLWVWIRRPIKSTCKFISTIHADINDLKTFGAMIKIFLWKQALKRFDKVVFLTDFHLSTIQSISNEKKVVIYNGRDVDFLLEPDHKDIIKINQLRSKYPILLCSNSSLHTRKGIDNTIRALQYLPNYALVILGNGPQNEELKNLSKQIGVEDQCLWLGYRVNGYRYYKLTDIYTLMSSSEGFPLSLIEAAAYEMPAICSDIEIFKCVLSGSDIYFAPRNNPLEYSCLITKTYEQRDVIANSLNMLYHKEMTVKSMCDKYLSIVYL